MNVLATKFQALTASLYMPIFASIYTVFHVFLLKKCRINIVAYSNGTTHI